MKKYFVLALLFSFSASFSHSFKKTLLSKKIPTIIINKHILRYMKLLSTSPKENLFIGIIKPTQKDADKFLKTDPNLRQYGFITETVQTFKIETRSQDDSRNF